jgi:hypothetical protein
VICVKTAGGTFQNVIVRNPENTDQLDPRKVAVPCHYGELADQGVHNAV